MALKLPSIPEIPLGTPQKDILDPIKETLEVWRGERKVTGRKTDAVVTYQDLVDLGLINETDIPR